MSVKIIVTVVYEVTLEQSTGSSEDDFEVAADAIEHPELYDADLKVAGISWTSRDMQISYR